MRECNERVNHSNHCQFILACLVCAKTQLKYRLFSFVLRRLALARENSNLVRAPSRLLPFKPLSSFQPKEGQRVEAPDDNLRPFLHALKLPV